MSKTVSTCLFETNQIPNKPQENVFFHSLYRTEPEFVDEFLRTAKSTSPIQICAIFSTQGPDSLAATLNIVLNKELANLVAEAQKQPVLDFEAFSNKVVNNLNIRVCNFIVSKGGTPLRTSMTILILDGDVLRVLHIGNTKAVLFRDNRIMALTEEHTVAHRYVQMNAISPDQEKTHPERDTLTQYLGKMPQDGPIKPDKKVNLKLKDGDELFLMGVGISKAIPQQMRNMIIAKPLSTDEKCREIIVSAYNYGVKYGLSILCMKIESTFLLPGDAVIAAASDQKDLSVVNDKKEESDFESFDDPFDDKKDSDVTELADTDTMTFDRRTNSDDDDDDKEDDDSDIKLSSRKKKRKSIILEILIYLLLLIIFAGAAFGALLLIFKNKNLIDSGDETTEPELTQQIVVMYVIDDNTPVYYEPNFDSVQIGMLSRGLQVNVTEIGEEFSQVDTGDVIGYVLNERLTYDPSGITEETITETSEETTEATTTTSRETTETTSGGIVVATLAGDNGATPVTTTTAPTTVVTTAATEPAGTTTTVTETTSETTVATETTAATETTTATETTVAETTAVTESTTAAAIEAPAAPVEGAEA